MNEIEKQIDIQMKKAFFDIITQNINSDNPDHDWLVKLYVEIKELLLNVLKKGSKMYLQLDEDFDVELFKQMIENKVFNQDSVIKLINNTYYWVQSLQAPMRDTMLFESKNRVFNSSPDEIIGIFLKEIHLLIDQLYKDVNNLKK